MNQPFTVGKKNYALSHNLRWIGALYFFDNFYFNPQTFILHDLAILSPN